MNTIIAMKQSTNHKPELPMQRLTRREKLNIQLGVVESAIRNAEETPELFSANFLSKQKARRAEILKELEELKGGE